MHAHLFKIIVVITKIEVNVSLNPSKLNRSSIISPKKNPKLIKITEKFKQ